MPIILQQSKETARALIHTFGYNITDMMTFIVPKIFYRQLKHVGFIKEIFFSAEMLTADADTSFKYQISYLFC